MSGFVFFGRGYLTTLAGSITKQERCVRCSTVFSYPINREVRGTSYSFYNLDNRGASERANQRARINLNRALNEAVEPVPCPVCGIF
jgi:hypothetical protein